MKDKLISIEGYKSIYDKQTIRLAPVTLLAGANSSGKSSFIQPLLLLKQTLDAPFDPGALLINGSNVKLTDFDQLLSQIRGREKKKDFKISVKDGENEYEISYQKHGSKGLEIGRQYIRNDLFKKGLWLKKDLTGDEIEKQMPRELKDLKRTLGKGRKKIQWIVERQRCFFYVLLQSEGAEGKGINFSSTFTEPFNDIKRLSTNIIHLPGLRGNPERTYKTTAVDEQFPGTFEQYVASVTSYWITNKNKQKLNEMGNAMKTLGLTWKVEARKLDDTQVELKVGRLTSPQKGGARDLVNIADVGFGVSQTLPVIVALLTARPSQTVYLEQPEIHLHPKAQLALADLIAKASDRGVYVIVETHSSLLLRGIQILVARGKLKSEKVALHWFSRDDQYGDTKVISAKLDKNGAFGDWPEDFDDTTLMAEQGYLDAVVEGSG